MACTKETAGDWESLRNTAKKLYGKQIRVKRRRMENSFSEVRESKTGHLIFKHTSMREVEKFIQTPDFLLLLRQAQQGFGFETGTFNSPDWN